MGSPQGALDIGLSAGDLDELPEFSDRDAALELARAEFDRCLASLSKHERILGGQLRQVNVILGRSLAMQSLPERPQDSWIVHPRHMHAVFERIARILGIIGMAKQARLFDDGVPAHAVVAWHPALTRAERDLRTCLAEADRLTKVFDWSTGRTPSNFIEVIK
jgi:hypothetical protein